MGCCGSSSNSRDEFIIASFDEASDDSTLVSTTDGLTDDKSLVVAGKLKMNLPGAIGISQLQFSSDNAIVVSNPLFGNRFATLFKSQDTFFVNGPTFYAVPVTEITPQLFFGSWEDANGEEKLKELGVTHIISLIGPKHEIKGMKHKHKPMSDHGRTDLKKVIKMLWPFILKSQLPGNKLFVHCQSGQNRSATVVLSILMKLKTDDLLHLYRMVKKKRPVVQINEKYAMQLSEMETELFGASSVPKDWLSINSYNLDTGDVFFNDEIKTTRQFSRNGFGSELPKTPNYLMPLKMKTVETEI